MEAKPAREGTRSIDASDASIFTGGGGRCTHARVGSPTRQYYSNASFGALRLWDAWRVRRNEKGANAECLIACARTGSEVLSGARRAVHERVARCDSGKGSGCFRCVRRPIRWETCRQIVFTCYAYDIDRNVVADVQWARNSDRNPVRLLLRYTVARYSVSVGTSNLHQQGSTICSAQNLVLILIEFEA